MDGARAKSEALGSLLQIRDDCMFFPIAIRTLGQHVLCVQFAHTSTSLLKAVKCRSVVVALLCNASLRASIMCMKCGSTLGVVCWVCALMQQIRITKKSQQQS